MAIFGCLNQSATHTGIPPVLLNSQLFCLRLVFTCYFTLKPAEPPSALKVAISV